MVTETTDKSQAEVIWTDDSFVLYGTLHTVFQQVQTKSLKAAAQILICHNLQTYVTNSHCPNTNIPQFADVSLYIRPKFRFLKPGDVTSAGVIYVHYSRL